jgi:methyl-accepting chemotaxis protein
MSTLPDNISLDSIPLDTAELERWEPEVSAKISAADDFISLVNAWDTSVNVIEINPEVVKSMSQVGRGITTCGESDYEPTPNDIEEKIDATYNKLCSLEISSTDSIDAIHQINGQLDNVSRNSATAAKNSRTMGDKLDELSMEMRGLNLRFEILNSEIKSIKELLTKLLSQNHDIRYI